MKYVDTNILVRIITGDNRVLAAQAITEIQRAGPNEFCILDAILVELCFILEFYDYKMARTDIASAIETLAATPQIFMSGKTLHAISLYKKFPKLDYADCLLSVLGGKTGILTFDKNLLKSL